MPDLSTMTAAELVERLAGFRGVSITRLAPGDSYILVGVGDGPATQRTVDRRFYAVTLFSDVGLFPKGVGHAPTLSAALEEALRKAEGNE
jgi:hypothetical protein